MEATLSPTENDWACGVLVEEVLIIFASHQAKCCLLAFARGGAPPPPCHVKATLGATCCMMHLNLFMHLSVHTRGQLFRFKYMELPSEFEVGLQAVASRRRRWMVRCVPFSHLSQASWVGRSWVSLKMFSLIESAVMPFAAALLMRWWIVVAMRLRCRSACLAMLVTLSECRRRCSSSRAMWFHGVPLSSLAPQRAVLSIAASALNRSERASVGAPPIPQDGGVSPSGTAWMGRG